MHIDSPILEGSLCPCLTQSLQLLNGVLPHGFNVDAGEAPLRGDLDEVGPLEAVWHNLVVVLGEVEQVFVVSEVTAGARKVEEGVIEVEAVVETMETVSRLTVVLVLIHLSEAVKV